MDTRQGEEARRPLPDAPASERSSVAKPSSAADQDELAAPGRPPSTFIVGPARSGTTLLYKALCLHPDAAWVSNWVARFPRFPQLAVLNRIARAFPGTTRRVWFSADSNAYVYGTKRPFTHRVFPMPVEGEPIYRRAGLALVPGSEVRAGAAEALIPSFEAIRVYGGGTRFVSKRIANDHRIPLLLDAFQGARFVAMVRDGRAVAHSLSRVDWWPDSVVWWYGGTPSTWEAEGRDPWELCARNWVEELRAIKAGLGQVAAERVMWLRYEDLIADPIPTLEGVARFVGLPEDRRWATELHALSFPNRNDPWRQRLAPETVATISEIQAEELRAYGYGT